MFVEHGFGEKNIIFLVFSFLGKAIYLDEKSMKLSKKLFIFVNIKFETEQQANKRRHFQVISIEVFQIRDSLEDAECFHMILHLLKTPRIIVPTI